MRVAFRVDASATIGIGHLKRCLSVAHALRSLGARILFVTRNLGLDTGAAIEAEGFEAIRLAPPGVQSLPERESADPPHGYWAGVSQSRDAAETINALASAGLDWMVVDHYAFDQRWHRAVAPRAARRVCVIDDLADRTLHADLVVDHNVSPDHRAKYASRVSGETRLLGGPRYALLAPAYGHAAPYRFRPTVESIGIFMGGADATRASELALHACRGSAGFAGPIQVATTSANIHVDALRSLCQRLGSCELLIDLPDLVAFFQRHDLQIGAGGGAAWERCCLGVPSLTMQCTSNQSVVVEALTSLDATRAIHTLDIDAVGLAIAGLVQEASTRLRLGTRSRELVDGHGAGRVAVAMFSSAVRLSPARLDDAAPMHRWRNDPRTRHHARSPEPIPLERHLAWWSQAISDESRHLLVAYAGSRAVGSVRFDFDDDSAEISIYLDPEMVGLGLGAGTLRAAQAWIACNAPPTRQVVAEIHPENAASIKAFVSAGFSRTGPTRWAWRVAPRTLPTASPPLDAEHHDSNRQP